MTKPPVYQSVENPSENKNEASTHVRRRPWQPGFFRRLPWLGAICILLALGCAAAAVGIAIESDRQPLDRWSVNGYNLQPAVLLSIVATVGNALLVYAFTRGATVHWWNQALDPKGTTLAQLHSSYHYGSGLTAIFSSLSTFNAVALAGLFMPILLMDTPFLQRSVNIEQTTYSTQFNATIPITSSPFFVGATGVMPDHYSVANLYHPVFANVLRQYTNREPVYLPNGTCTGTCEVEVVAPGFDIECTESTEPYRLISIDEWLVAQSQLSSNGTELKNSTYDGPKPVQTIFDIDVIYNYTLPAETNPYEFGLSYYIGLQVRRKSTPGGNGTTALHNCQLIEALVKYPLVLQNSTVSLGPMPLSVNRTVERVYRQAETATMGNQPSTIGGFWLALQNSFQTNAKLAPVGGWYQQRDTNPIASQYLRASNASELGSTQIYYDDPMPDMISMANELAFRTAYYTTNNVPGSVFVNSQYNLYNLTSEQPYIISPNLTSVNRTIQQQAVLSQATPITVYATHRGWLAAAASLMFLAAILITVTYWGFWRLGRPVSMSPLEIARAFDAPIMQRADPNATGQDLKKQLGGQRIYPGQYANGTFYEKAGSGESVDA